MAEAKEKKMKGKMFVRLAGIIAISMVIFNGIETTFVVENTKNHVRTLNTDRYEELAQDYTRGIARIFDEYFAYLAYYINADVVQTKDTEQISLIASSHHEKYNGNGYYRGLKGEEIPLGGRILAVADVFDAITSKRHYRDKMPIKDVISILLEDSGSHFDSNIVNNFLDISCDKIIEVFSKENHKVLSEDDKNMLHTYTMKEFYNILNSPIDNMDNMQKKFCSLFERHYIN